MNSDTSFDINTNSNPVQTVAQPKEDNEMLRATDKITALYCRLSVEDTKEDKKNGKEDLSNSIQNQKAMLLQYARDHRFPQPTFFIDTNERAYNDDGLTGLDREFLTIDNTTYRVHGTGDSCNAKTFTETVASADAVKNHAKLYTVCFDAEEKIDVPNNGGQISVSEYLSTKIATQPTKTGEQFAYDADNAEKLYAEFAKITQSIVSGLNNGTVRDTLPTGITSEAFGEDNVKEWKLNEKPFTKNETTNTVDGKQVTTYTDT